MTFEDFKKKGGIITTIRPATEYVKYDISQADDVYEAVDDDNILDIEYEGEGSVTYYAGLNAGNLVSLSSVEALDDYIKGLE